MSTQAASIARLLLFRVREVVSDMRPATIKWICAEP